jgi:hypothetical protein
MHVLTVRSAIFFGKRDLLSRAYARAYFRDGDDLSSVNSSRYFGEELSPEANELVKKGGELTAIF